MAENNSGRFVPLLRGLGLLAVIAALALLLVSRRD